MTKKLHQILREPLIHFLLIGFILYLYYHQTAIKESPTKKSITVSQNEITQIKKRYKKENNESINEEQLSLEIALKLYKKVLLQEAYRLKLEREDSEVKKRLLQQMEFIVNNTESFTEPTEEQLYQYYQKNIVDYSNLQFLSFNYLTFEDNEDTAGLAQTEELIKHLHVKNIQGQKKVVNISEKDVKKEFGNYFFHKIQNVKLFHWSEPINSKKGVHLLYIVDKCVSYPYEFEEVEERVYEDYKREFLKQKKLEEFEKISQQYISK